MKREFVAAANQPIPEANSSNTRPEENGNTQFEENGPSQAPVGAGDIPRVVATQYQDHTSIYHLSASHTGPYRGPYQYTQAQTAHSGYTELAGTQHTAESQDIMGHGDTSNYDPRLLGYAGENTDSTQCIYPPPR